MCKRNLIIILMVALAAASCGSAGQYSNAGRFQDGIYYKASDAADEYVPLSEEEIKARVELQRKAQRADTVVIAVVDADDYYWNSWCYGRYSWRYRPFGWRGGWYDPYWYGAYGLGWSYAWNYGWYDPFWYDPFWYDPYWYGGYMYSPYWYGGYHHHHHGGYYAYGTSVAHPGRTMSSAGIVSRVPSGSAKTSEALTRSVSRSVSAMRRTASSPRSTAANRAPATSGYEYRTPAATRGGNPASYNGPQRTSQPSYRTSEPSYRSSGATYRSSGSSSFGGSGSYGGSHSSGGVHSHGGRR